MQKKKNYILLCISLILTVIGIATCIYTYQNGFTKSKETNTLIKELKEQAKLSDQGTELDLQIQKLSETKLKQERPYSYALVFTILCFLLLIKGIKDATLGVEQNKQPVDIKRLTQAGLCAALCYIGFAVFKIDIPVGTEKTAFHFGNVFCVLAALLIGGYWGGLSGAIGMTIGDLTTAYVSSAPKTFFLKLCIGLITGFIAHKIFKLSKEHSKKYIVGATLISCIGGMGFNIIADPLVGYFYKTWLLGIPQDIAKALAKMAAVTTFVNAIVAVTAATIFYLALRPALKKSGLFISVSKETK